MQTLSSVAKFIRYWTYQIFSPGTVLREKYEAFRSLLAHDKCAHEVIAELEEIYYGQVRVDFQLIAKKYDQLSSCVSGIIENLSGIHPSRYLTLRDYSKKFDSYIRFMLTPPVYPYDPPYTIQLDQISSDKLSLVGGKALQLSVIRKNIQLPVPSGFVISTNAFYYFIEHNHLRKAIDTKLSDLDINSHSSLNRTSEELIALVMNARIPPDLEDAVFDAYKACQWANKDDIRIAMRSSAVGEDGPSSFAGQYTTVLDVKQNRVLNAYKEVVASKYAPRALYYRINYGLSDPETPMAVLALEMIDAEASGIIYTRDMENPLSCHLNIHSVWGLGELLVSGSVSPDLFTVSKEKKPRIVLEKAGDKDKEMILSKDHGPEVLAVHADRKQIPSIDHASLMTLARWSVDLEKFYGEPQDIEWCRDHSGRLFILQSRPLKFEESPTQDKACEFDKVQDRVLVSGGENASSGIGGGRVFQIDSDSDLKSLPQGAVLVARTASPHYVAVMGKLNAVVIDKGSTAGHFSSVAREFGVPTLVNTGDATSNLPSGIEVTVHADAKVVYEGIVNSLMESQCARRDLLSNSPFMRKLESIMSFISPLRLVSPDLKSFSPEGCRSLHDIIRFSHEKAVQEMFTLGTGKVTRKKGARKLSSKIPMLFYVLDVGGGLEKGLPNSKTVKLEEIKSAPMKALLKGMLHPHIRWSKFTHFDWASYDRIVMSGGIISAESSQFGSYAVIASDYMNLNLRFGYHFVIVDTLCGDKAEENYVLFRFTGGGGDSLGRSLRAAFIGGILDRLGFGVNIKGDLIDGQLDEGSRRTILDKLDMVGRLLGATRLMDMYLKDETQVEGFVEDFMKGRYHFASIED